MNPISKTNFQMILGCFACIAVSFALFSPQIAGATMYLPGETLEPACAPTASGCGVISNISAYFTATSTTQASTFPYASSTALTVSGSSYLGTILSSIWNGSTIGVGYGGTGQTSFNQGWLHTNGTTFTASTSPTVAYLTATSTTTSTFPYASTTAITATTASTTNLIVSNNSTLGAVISGLWNGSTVGVAYGGTGLSSYTLGDVLYASGTGTLAGTTTANLKTTLALNNVENTALSTWAGTTNITTLGTIATGVWNGTAITVGKGGTGQTSFGQGWLHTDGTTFTASTSPTVNYIVATSTTATSTFPLFKATTAFELGSDYITDITGTNLSITDGVLSATGGSGGSNSKWATSTDTTSIYLNSATKVGIGTSSPLTTLHINGPAMANALVLTSSSTAYSTLTSFGGFNGYINASGGFGTGGSDSVLNASRITAYGNLTNIGSVQGGELNLTRGGTFASKVDYTTGTGPISVSVGDVNSDGKPDLVTTNGAGTVSVFINNGNGTFAAKVDYSVAGGFYSVAIKDLNGDGKADLAVANVTTNSVSILMNNGNGTFATKVDYSVGNDPRSVVASDLNGDGKADLAVANIGTDDSISILINNGDGTFATKVDYTAGFDPRSIAAGDFNGDGKPDLAVADWNSSSVSVFMNKGNGTFAAKVDYLTGDNIPSYPESVAVGDVNGDGKADMVVANYNNSYTVSVFISNGNGTFATKVDYLTGANPMSVVVGDMNGDGKADLATANFNTNTVSVLVNNGNGTFATKVDYTTGSQARYVSIGDFNSDGKLDLVTSNYNSNSISVFLNTPATMLFAQASTGNIVIGTTSPWSKLSIQNTYGSQTPLFDIASSTSAAYATSSVFRVNANGNIGIATTTPWRTLSITGTMSATALTAGAAGDFAVCINDTTKEITNAGATGCVVSSKRFKENISALDSSLDELMQLKPSKFAYIGKTGEHIGLIAEDVDAIDKRLVEYEADGITPRTVRYMEISALLIKSIQEQQLSIEQIKQTIASSTSTQSSGLVSQSFQWIIDQFSSVLGVVFNKGEITTDKVRTKEICLGSTCVTEEQFKSAFGSSSSSSILIQYSSSSEIATSTASSNISSSSLSSSSSSENSSLSSSSSNQSSQSSSSVSSSSQSSNNSSTEKTDSSQETVNSSSSSISSSSESSTSSETATSSFSSESSSESVSSSS